MYMDTENIIPIRPDVESGTRKMTILSVEDDRVEQAFLRNQIRELGHSVLQVMNGVEAIEILKKRGEEIDIILMDRRMPEMDGLSAVQEIKKRQVLKNIPIVMVSAATSPMEIKEGIEAGIFYYLNKPVEEEVLKSVLTAAAHEVEKRKILFDELKKHRKSFDMMEYGKFICRTLDDAESLAAFIALCFPEPEKAITGIAELIMNAVEHGNLGIGYAEKTALLKKGEWRDEVKRRSEAEDNKKKFVTVVLQRKVDGVYVVITDMGKGFNWRRYMAVDPARASDNHGRGIARAANGCFERVVYNDVGNQVVAYMGRHDIIEW